jgi:hypothetical protein
MRFRARRAAAANLVAAVIQLPVLGAATLVRLRVRRVRAHPVRVWCQLLRKLLRATRCNSLRHGVGDFDWASGTRTSPQGEANGVGTFGRSKPGGQKSRNGQSRSSAGLSRDSPVPICALLCSTIATAVRPHRFSINSPPTESGSYKFGSLAAIRSCPAGSPLQGKAHFNVRIYSDGLPVPLFRYATRTREWKWSQRKFRLAQWRIVRVAPMAG